MSGSNFLQTQGVQFTDANYAPYPDAWIGMANTIQGTAPWLRLGGIVDAAGTRRLGIIADVGYVSGRLGIGTAAPQSPLQLRTMTAMSEGGGVWSNFGSNAYYDGAWKRVDTARAGVNLHMTADDGAGQEFRFLRMEANGGNQRNIAAIGTGVSFIKEGNFGVGTVGPTHRFHVVAPDAVGLFESSGSQAYLRLSTAEGLNNRVEITNRPGGRLSLWVPGGGDVFNILRDGKVGIGTTTPAVNFHVASGAIIGGVVIGGDAPGLDYPYEYETVGVSNPNFNLRLQSPNGIVFHVKPGGTIETTEHFQTILRCADFRIGAAGRRGSTGRALVDDGARLVVNYGPDWGAVRVEGNFSYGSSREHKQDITDLSVESALGVIRGLNPVRFTFKDDPAKKTCLGFIAEDVPNAVASEDRKGIEPAGLVAVLVKAVQEQMRTIDAMAARLDAVECRG